MKQVFIALFIVTLSINSLYADLRYNQTTGQFYSTCNLSANDRILYHRIVSDIVIMINNTRNSMNEVTSSLNERLGTNISVPNNKVNLQSIIIDYLMKLSRTTPVATIVLEDIRKLNYLL